MKKLYLTILMMALSHSLLASECKVEVAGEMQNLKYMYLFNKPNTFNKSKTDLMIICSQSVIEKDKLNLKDIVWELRGSDKKTLKILVDKKYKKVIDVSLSWGDNINASYSGVVGDVKFIVDINENTIKANLNSIKDLSADKTDFAVTPMKQDKIKWSLSIEINQSIEKL